MPRAPLLSLLIFPLAATAANPVISAVLNGASYSEVFAPGCWMTIYGANLAPSGAVASSLPLPKSLLNTSVTVDGHPAALLYVSPTQVNALIPFEVAASGNKKVTVALTAFSITRYYSIYVNHNAPSLFTLNSAGTGRALVFDGSFKRVDQPTEGDVVILYAAGLGETDPPASSDNGAAGANQLLDEVEVFMGDQQAEVLYAGLSPGLEGVYQLNVRVPRLWTDRLYLRQGGWLSNVVRIGLPAQSNADRVVASITPVTPTAAHPVWSSLPLLAAQYEVELYVRPGAKPFVVAAVAEGGGSFTRIDPANGMAETFITSPTDAARQGDFSLWPWLMVMDFAAGCQPFPGNVIPVSQLDPAVMMLLSYDLAPPDMTFRLYPVGILTSTEGLQADGRFSINGVFGDFVQLACGSRKTGKTTFELFVDGRVVASEDVAYSIAGR